MAHGEGREADDLNRITKGYLTEHEEDVVDAQVRCDVIIGNNNLLVAHNPSFVEFLQHSLQFKHHLLNGTVLMTQ